jgi:hypothetical protein
MRRRSGTELVVDWASPFVDYAKSGMYVGLNHFLLHYIHAPLLNLVYHDSMVLFDGTVGTARVKEYNPEVLECLAYGINPVFSFSLPYYDSVKDVLREESAALSDFLADVSEAELLSHHFLDDGYNVQRTVFASGAEAIINTNTHRFILADGQEIPARGFVTKDSKGCVRRGQISSKMSVNITEAQER